MARILTGIVSSDQANKTIVITVASRKTHPLYKKQYTVNTKFMAHDENNIAKIGDLVTITEHRPISSRKRFVLKTILKTAQVGFNEQDAMSDVPKEELKANNQEPAAAAAKKISAKNSRITDKTAGRSVK